MLLPTYQCREAVMTAAVKAAVNGIGACSPEGSNVAVTINVCATEQTIWLAFINQIKVAFCYIFGLLTDIQAEIAAIQNNMRTPGNVNIAVGSSLGSGATVAIVGNDTAGQITIECGVGGGFPGQLFTLTFDTPYTTAGILRLIPNNHDAYGFELSTECAVGTAAGSIVAGAIFVPWTGQELIFNYVVMGGT